jgi:predicted flap endonuclease-1-like 5' DNA nuclease
MEGEYIMAYTYKELEEGIVATTPKIEVILPIGRHVLELVVEDSAGLRSEPDRVVITVEQEAVPEITGIEPSSGQQGTTPEAVIVGRGLAEASRTRFSGEGVGCRVLRSSDRKVDVELLIYSTAPLGERTFQLLRGRDIIVDSKDFEITFEVTRGLPTVTRPTVTRPTATGPTITRPTVTRPTVTRPTITRPTVTMPTATRPIVTRPISTVPIITRPIVPPRAPERLVEIPGIGPASEEKLHTAGIRSVKDLALASPERVAEILGILDMNKAKAFIDEAKRLIR